MSKPLKISASGEFQFDPSKPEGQRFSGSLNLSDASVAVGNKPEEREAKLLEMKLEAWSKVIDVQMHFNEMSSKNRQLGLAFAAAALGLAIFLLNRQPTGGDVLAGFLSFGRASIHVSSLIVVGSMLAVVAVWILDIRHYHRLLRGAVALGDLIESQLKGDVFPAAGGLTQVISHYSQYNYERFKLPGQPGYPALADFSGNKDVFAKEESKYNAEKRETKSPAVSRLNWFYGVIIAALALIAVMMSVAVVHPSRPMAPNTQPQPAATQVQDSSGSPPR